MFPKAKRGTSSWHAQLITFKEFRRRYAAEDACRAELFRLRFPMGLFCPKEPLNKSPSAVSGSFPSTLRYRKTGNTQYSSVSDTSIDENLSPQLSSSI